jgi:ankyrin repeat protein
MPKNFNKIERPQTAMIAEQLNNPKINSNKMQRCANCQKEILESEFVAHSLICLRHTFRCKKCGELINEKDKKKHLEKYRNPTKILNSIKNNNLQEFTIILEHGLKSDLIIEPILGDHLYHSICRYNRINFIKELMKKKFPLDINALNKNKETPLATAIECKSGECGEYMIKLGCDINLRNKGDLSPLMLAAKKGMKKIFEILVNKGANINDKNILGETPLSLAQANHHEDLAMFILQRSQLKFNKK